jgi:hypothetical protein
MGMEPWMGGGEMIQVGALAQLCKSQSAGILWQTSSDPCISRMVSLFDAGNNSNPTLHLPWPPLTFPSFPPATVRHLSVHLVCLPALSEYHATMLPA